MASAALYHAPVNRSEVSLDAPTLPPYTEHATTTTPTARTVETGGYNTSNNGIELSDLSLSTATSATTSRTSGINVNINPHHDTFRPSRNFQIQTPGKALISLPTPQRPDPIPIYALSPTATATTGVTGGNVTYTLPESEQQEQPPLYLSIRPETCSGSCILVHGDDYNASVPLTTTTYRFGPGKPPIVVLGHGHGHGYGEADGDRGSGGMSGELRGDSFPILGRSLFSRAVSFDVPGLGSFGWRYGNKAERAAADADSLLICEFFLPNSSSPPSLNPNSGAGAGAFEEVESESESESGEFETASVSMSGAATGTDENNNNTTNLRHRHGHSLSAKLGFHTNRSRAEVTSDGKTTGAKSHKEKKDKSRNKDDNNKVIIAQLVRNAAFRSPGSSRSSAGNGGRLMLDLRMFDDDEKGARRERVEWLVVTTAVSMLKREVDRRRAQQAAALGVFVA
jgi:hypothetical protein